MIRTNRGSASKSQMQFVGLPCNTVASSPGVVNDYNSRLTRALVGTSPAKGTSQVLAHRAAHTDHMLTVTLNKSPSPSHRIPRGIRWPSKTSLQVMVCLIGLSKISPLHRFRMQCQLQRLKYITDCTGRFAADELLVHGCTVT